MGDKASLPWDGQLEVLKHPEGQPLPLLPAPPDSRAKVSSHLWAPCTLSPGEKGKGQAAPSTLPTWALQGRGWGQ